MTVWRRHEAVLRGRGNGGPPEVRVLKQHDACPPLDGLSAQREEDLTHKCRGEVAISRPQQGNVKDEPFDAHEEDRGNVLGSVHDRDPLRSPNREASHESTKCGRPFSALACERVDPRFLART